MAAAYLREKGHTILSMNYKNSFGEIDIISRSGSFLVFTECKFRKNNNYGSTFEAVDKRKQKKICMVALSYLKNNGYNESTPCRFDVIGIYADKTINHAENAFEFTSYF